MASAALFLYKNIYVNIRYLYMHILTTSTDSQTLKIVARKDATSPTFTLTDKSKRTSSTVSVTKGTDGDYMTLSGSFTLKEGDLYSFTVKDGSDIIYKGLIFCTDQTDYDKYFENKDEYVHEDTYDNDFVII